MNGEYYLACGQTGFAKYLFWEVALYKDSNTMNHSVDLDRSIVIHHRSELSDMKPYWTEQPWYLSEESEEARVVKTRMEQLVAEFGPEPMGAARASNPVCDPFIRTIRQRNPTYVNIYR